MVDSNEKSAEQLNTVRKTAVKRVFIKSEAKKKAAYVGICSTEFQKSSISDVR